jgi:hypothetical protein
LQARHQHATQGIAQGQTEAAFQRFSDDGSTASRICARLDDQLRRLDEFLPVLMDHAVASILVSPPMSSKRETPEGPKKPKSGRATKHGPTLVLKIRRGDASAGGSHCAPAG